MYNFCSFVLPSISDQTLSNWIKNPHVPRGTSPANHKSLGVSIAIRPIDTSIRVKRQPEKAPLQPFCSLTQSMTNGHSISNKLTLGWWWMEVQPMCSSAVVVMMMMVPFPCSRWPWQCRKWGHADPFAKKLHSSNTHGHTHPRTTAQLNKTTEEFDDVQLGLPDHVRWNWRVTLG